MKTFEKPGLLRTAVTRTYIMRSLILFVVISSCSLLLQARDANIWPIFRGNTALTGTAQSTLPDNLNLIWQHRVGDAEIHSTAAIFDSLVFIGTTDGDLLALSLKNGTPVWQIQDSIEIKGSTAIKDGRVYYGNGDGIFRARDLFTGREIWQFAAESEILSSANFVGNNLVFGSYDQFAYCLDRDTGELLWKVETDNYIHATPAVYNKSILITGCDGYLRQISAEDGTEVHKVSLAGYVAASPAVINDHAYFGTYDSQVVCVDLKNHELAWTFEDRSRQFAYYASAAVTDDVVIVAGRDKVVRALNPSTGEEIWSKSNRSKLDASPIICGNDVVYATLRGNIIRLDVATGAEKWRFESGSGITASPAVASGRLIISTLDGIILCFGK